ncbi:hypothetical protein [Flavobacterium sp. '19STA2R22 D10 B1']|uniref:hypothetical protein n=1 Tax=Flavobacterium aerium TaxID=3037261 RepID=UPI00278C4F9B|nr:hypothetical protein [Flavobacterium sp. '19STA2R22 D10 B1']
MTRKNISPEHYKKSVSFDLKAELLFEELLLQRVHDLDISIESNGLFYRKFNKDIMDIDTDVHDSDIYNVTLSRDGIYDVLPESVTHNYRTRDRKEDPVEEFKKRKKEEKEARTFYNPLENELFRFRHLVERYESDFFSHINTYGIADIIRMILGVSSNIPNHLLVKMFSALLHEKKNLGQDILNVSSILEKIINEKVSVTTKNIKLEQVFDVNESAAEISLGVNSTLESREEIFLKEYHYTIGPLRDPEQLFKYFHQEEMESFLITFFNLFLPCHVQFSYELVLKGSDEEFSMNETSYQSRLGISTVI